MFFAQSKVTFVGHVIGTGMIEPDPVKIATVKEIKPPVTKKDIRSLIGFSAIFVVSYHPWLKRLR